MLEWERGELLFAMASSHAGVVGTQERISDPEAMVFIVAARPFTSCPWVYYHMRYDFAVTQARTQGTTINLHGVHPSRWYST